MHSSRQTSCSIVVDLHHWLSLDQDHLTCGLRSQIVHLERNERNRNPPTRQTHSCTFYLDLSTYQEQLIHDRWLPADQLRIHMHVKFNIVADEIQFSQGAMIKVVNKMLPFVSMEPNIIEDTDGIGLKVYRRSFQVKKRFTFFWFTRMDGTTPSMMPSTWNALNWEEDCVLKRLIAGARTHSLDINMMTNEPQAKRPKVLERARTEATISAATHQETATSNSPTSSWWESGDACRLFAPCTANYESTECIKGIQGWHKPTFQNLAN